MQKLNLNKDILNNFLRVIKQIYHSNNLNNSLNNKLLSQKKTQLNKLILNFLYFGISKYRNVTYYDQSYNLKNIYQILNRSSPSLKHINEIRSDDLSEKNEVIQKDQNIVTKKPPKSAQDQQSQMSVNSLQQKPDDQSVQNEEEKKNKDAQIDQENKKKDAQSDKENKPVEKTMKQEMQDLKEVLKDGDAQIKRTEDLLRQTERQIKKQGIGKNDDERQKYYQELIRKKREYEDEYFRKTKEFYMTQGMNMDKIQNFIIENFEMNLQQQRNQLEGEIKEKEKIQQDEFEKNRKKLDIRHPQVSNIRNTFFKQSKEIFRPLKQLDINLQTITISYQAFSDNLYDQPVTLYQEIKEKQKTYDVQEYMEKRASERLEEQYYQTYYEWSIRQPAVEDQRNRLKSLFADCFELTSILNNQPESLDKPKIYTLSNFTENEKKYVDEWMRKKNLIKTNKYGFLEDDQEFEADDILRKTEKYLDTELFVQQDYNEEQYSDEELQKFQEPREPYNEQTMEDYDAEVDKQQA